VKQFKVHVQAHRGASSELPENSIESVVRAVELGAHSVEIDLHLLKDNRFLVLHDFFIGSCHVSGLTSKDPAIRGLPFFEDIIDSLRNVSAREGFFLDLEIKNDLQRASLEKTDEIANALVLALQKISSSIPIAIRSFDWNILKSIHKKSPHQPIIALVDQDFSCFEEAIQLSTEWVAVPQEKLDLPKIKKVKSAGKKVMVYTVNEEKEWEKWIEAGVEGITTDRVREILNRLDRPFSQ